MDYFNNYTAIEKQFELNKEDITLLIFKWLLLLKINIYKEKIIE